MVRMKAVTEKDRQNRHLYDKAHKAGVEAAEAATPTPMVVTDGDLAGNPIPGRPVYYVPEGPCGFAWVKVNGNSSFGRWATKTGAARKSYTGGVQFWVSEFGQSYERKSAYASAFARVLNENGVKAFAGSRLD